MNANTPSHLSHAQRLVLTALLESRRVAFERLSTLQLEGQSQVEAARRVLLQDADDARQREGTHEVEGIVADIDSGEYTAIRAALERIHGAAYGLCVDCHVEIPFDRLQIEPQTLRCITCQTLHKRKSKP